MTTKATPAKEVPTKEAAPKQATSRPKETVLVRDIHGRPVRVFSAPAEEGDES